MDIIFVFLPQSDSGCFVLWLSSHKSVRSRFTCVCVDCLKTSPVSFLSFFSLYCVTSYFLVGKQLMTLLTW